MSPVPQPPFPAELLADLHAGNIDPAVGDQLWPAVRADPDARRYLESLDEVRGSLAGLRDTDRVLHPIPTGIASRLDALAESLGDAAAPRHHGDGESRSVPTPVPRGSTAPAVPAPDRVGESMLPDTAAAVVDAHHAAPVSLAARRRRSAAALAAAAVVLIAAAGALFLTRPDRDTAPTAAPTTVVEPDTDLDTAVALRALGRNDVGGRLADPAALDACVQAVGIDRPVLGSTDMRFRGRDDAVLVLLGGRNGAQITALVVGPGCGPGNPDVLTATDIG